MIGRNITFCRPIVKDNREKNRDSVKNKKRYKGKERDLSISPELKTAFFLTKRIKNTKT
jgi:hypothetical protein